MDGLQGSLFEYPPRSPDLTPCDFFLLGYLRELVYAGSPMNSLDELQEKVKGCLEDIPLTYICFVIVFNFFRTAVLNV